MIALVGITGEARVADRRYLSEGSMAFVTNPPTEEIDQTDSPQLPAA